MSGKANEAVRRPTEQSGGLADCESAVQNGDDVPHRSSKDVQCSPGAVAGQGLAQYGEAAQNSAEDLQEGCRTEQGSSGPVGSDEAAQGDSNSQGPKLLFGAPVDGTIMKLTTGWRTSSKKNCESRIHRVGTSWLRGQKLPSVRQRVVKRLRTDKKRERMREDEGN